MGDYVTMTMCHCGDPDDDHWAVGIPVAGYQPKTGYVSIAAILTKGFRTRKDAQLFADAKNQQQSELGH